MDKSIKSNKFLEFIKLKGPISYSSIKENFSTINEATLVRNLNKLIKEGQINKTKEGKNTSYQIIDHNIIQEYFKKDFFERATKKYNFDFLEKYIPNETSFLGKRYSKIKDKYDNIGLLSTYDYKTNIRGIENLLIDLSFSSSKLEGNTYNYLDTEVLIKYNQQANGRTQFESQMILNHKNAIKYIIDNRNIIEYTKYEFYIIHKLLAKGLLIEDYLGTIRSSEVKIGGSTYFPLDNKFQLEEQFELFLNKLNKIKNPFEQSLFILVFIPYFQLFMDINKRVSRIASNIPLIKNGLPPFSFLQINDRDYITAILAIYELNDVSLMADIYVENYILNMNRYI
ncbi:MAG: Fic family protein [Candidatus Gracilibacteria bacterium]|nr:Fic family protein [Candidatus Gracilibacteria bacterium]MDD2908666.1 Fic family protein [Candidatus Gracilibacteria bacterium]